MSICAFAVTPPLTVTPKPASRANGNFFFFYSKDILQFSDYRKKKKQTDAKLYGRNRRVMKWEAFRGPGMV